ncbi:MAG TPA: sigma-54 dependent transcriptional regulator [Longimicrobiales bacterium]|nr:sigma-54 dependent transcriptional regulator [Longimicrobiales bacterium]
MADILIIDDHDSMREGLELLLRRRGHRTRAAESGRRGLAMLSDESADLVITDLKMARMDGMEVLRRVKQATPETEVMVITAHGTIEKVVEAMKCGAADFITKPFSSEEFGVKVDRLLAEHAERVRLRRENAALRVENTYLREETKARYGEIVGASPSMERVFRWIERVARSDSTVMIYGESGTGKELVARAIHARSPRREGPFVRVNCGALAESLLDSELFGHEKGAFTGAEKRRRGRFELANGGTLFLDEIATVPHPTQVRLLRVLQERELERVGGEETIPVDVRIIAATNATVENLRGATSFREDLFYRLHVIPVTLPPLRDRMEDVPLLVEHFIAKLASRTASPARTASPEALERLVGYRWPGNVRELENVIERAHVLADGEELRAEDIPPLGAPTSQVARPWRAASGNGDLDLPDGGVDLNRTVEGMEEQLLRQALERAGGVKAEAARLLGLKPSALYYKLEKYGIEA